MRMTWGTTSQRSAKSGDTIKAHAVLHLALIAKGSSHPGRNGPCASRGTSASLDTPCFRDSAPTPRDALRFRRFRDRPRLRPHRRRPHARAQRGRLRRRRPHARQRDAAAGGPHARGRRSRHAVHGGRRHGRRRGGRDRQRDGHRGGARSSPTHWRNGSTGRRDVRAALKPRRRRRTRRSTASRSSIPSSAAWAPRRRSPACSATRSTSRRWATAAPTSCATAWRCRSRRTSR